MVLAKLLRMSLKSLTKISWCCTEEILHLMKQPRKFSSASVYASLASWRLGERLFFKGSLAAATLMVAAIPAHAADELQEFWRALAQNCGKAFEGVRVVARDDRPDLLAGDETLVVHFRECSDELLTLPFHIGLPDGDWDRSRTWRFTWAESGTRLELRHDHRLPDGSPDVDNTMYGGLSVGGDGSVQRFVYTERVADDGSPLGWQIEIVPGERYTYGTFSGERWTWRLDFDLRRPLSEVPPAPWGFKAEAP